MSSPLERRNNQANFRWGQAIKQLRAAFRHIDTANEGFIKFTELETLLTRAGPAYTSISPRARRDS